MANSANLSARLALSLSCVASESLKPSYDAYQYYRVDNNGNVTYFKLKCNTETRLRKTSVSSKKDALVVITILAI